MSPGSPHFTVPDQSGRVAVVTGANSGLGFATCQALAAGNAQVIMACRSGRKGQQARARLLEAVPGAEVRVEQLDLSDLENVREFAQRVLPGLPRLDLLINNAGVMALPRALSADGYEMHFATNHLGHFLLTGLLLPSLLDTADSRVISVSSLAARAGRINLDDLTAEVHYDRWSMYNQSKLANLLFGLELQRRLARSGAATSSVIAHPGTTLTNVFFSQGSYLFQRTLLPLLRRFVLQSAAEGAQSLLYAATSPEAAPGGFYGPAYRNETAGPPAPAYIPLRARDREMARELWEVSEKIVQLHYLDGGAGHNQFP